MNTNDLIENSYLWSIIFSTTLGFSLAALIWIDKLYAGEQSIILAIILLAANLILAGLFYLTTKITIDRFRSVLDKQARE